MTYKTFQDQFKEIIEKMKAPTSVPVSNYQKELEAEKKKIAYKTEIYEKSRWAKSFAEAVIGYGVPGAGLAGKVLPGIEKITQLVEEKEPQKVKKYFEWLHKEYGKQGWIMGKYTPEQTQYLQEHPEREQPLKMSWGTRGIMWGGDYAIKKGIVTPEEAQLFPVTEVGPAVTGMEEKFPLRFAEGMKNQAGKWWMEKAGIDITKATPKQLQRGYFDLSKIRHPDKPLGSPEAFKELEMFYKIAKGDTTQIIKDTKLVNWFKDVFTKQVKPTIPKVIAEKERGFVTSVKEVIPELKISGQYIPRSTDKLAIEAVDLIKSDINAATKLAMTGTDDKAVATASELIKHYGVEASKATDETVKNALYDKAAEITNSMAHKLTELGRSVQAASILGRLTPEGQVRFAAQEIQNYNAKMESIKGGEQKKVPELTPEQTKDILTEMEEIGKMPEGEDKAIRFQKLQNHISDLVPSPFIDKLIATWKAGLLTGIKTSGLNIFSNISHAGTEIIKDVPAKVVDSVTSLFTGKQTIGLTLKGMGGILDGFKKGIRYLKTGFDERNVGAKLDWKRVNFGTGKIAKALQKYEETIFHIMGAEDQPFYYGAKAHSLADQAIAQANNQGLKGAERKAFIDNLIQNPTDEMVRYAVLDAEIAIYQNPTQLGTIAKSVQKTKIGEFIVPFGRTPSAVATQIINYSPVGIPKAIIENIGKGRFDQRDFSKAIGRSIVGIAAVYIGSKLYEEGRIALDRPKTEREQKLWELEGRKANSVYVGGTCKDGKCSGGAWRSIITLGPNGNLLLVGGYFQKEYNETGSPTGAMMTSVLGGASSFTEQTFLQGINQVVSALNDPERSAEGYFGSALSSVIPTISGDIAKAIDPKERRTETILERIQAKIPGLREALEPKIDVLGREMESIGNPLEIMIDPTRPSPDISNPLVKELRRLFDKGYKVSPTLLGDKKGYEGLTQKQNTALWKRAGEITNSKLTGLINTQTYHNLPDDKKAKIVEIFVDKSKLVARVGMVIELTQGLEGQKLTNKLGELKNSGLMTREVFTLYMELK